LARQLPTNRNLARAFGTLLGGGWAAGGHRAHRLGGAARRPAAVFIGRPRQVGAGRSDLCGVGTWLL